jgi:hypothetical protein
MIFKNLIWDVKFFKFWQKTYLKLEFKLLILCLTNYYILIMFLKKNSVYK